MIKTSSGTSYYTGALRQISAILKCQIRVIKHIIAVVNVCKKAADQHLTLCV